MAEVGIAAFHDTRLTFIEDCGVFGITIDQSGIRRETVTVIRLGLRRSINQGLQPILAARLHHGPANIPVCRAIQQGYDVEFVFWLSPTCTTHPSPWSLTALAWVGHRAGGRQPR